MEYGLAKGRHISSQVWQFYTLLREILTENGFEAAVADRLAQTLAKMKNGSLEILVITGVIKEGERNIFVSKDSNKLRVLDNQEKEEFAGRLKRLYVSYRRNLNKTYQQTMLKRLIPLEIIELLSFEYDTSMGNIRHIISAHPDFQIRLPKVKTKVEQIKDRVGGHSNAWRIVISQGLDKTDTWLSLAESKVNSIQNKVGGSANAWAIVIGHGLDKMDAWLSLAESKVNSIQNKVGGSANAWRIVIGQGLDKIDTWFSLAESKVNSIQNKVGGSANAWAIVIGQGLDKIDTWLSLAESKVNSIQDRVGGSVNAWRIVVSQGLDKIDAWLSLAESKVNSIQDRVGGSTNAWYIVIWQGLYKGGASLKSIDTDVINNDGNNIAGSTSSPSIPATGNKSGGIDFHALPIQTESVASSALSIFYGANAFKGNLDAEWARIQQVFNAGIRPSIQRLSEYTAAAAASPLAEDKIDQVRVMLADILRRDEESEKLASAEESCKQLLRALEAG